MRGKFLILSLFAVCQVLWSAELAQTVSVVKPERRDVTRWLRLPAYVEADAEVTIYAKVSGFLKDLSVDVGDIVKPGQLIGRLDAPELEQDMMLAEAQLKSADADYQKTAAELEHEQSRGKEIDAEELVARAEVAKTNAVLDRVRAVRDRTDKLFAANATTELEHDNEKYLTLESEAGVAASEKKVEQFKADREVWEKQVLVSKATVEAAKGKVAVAKAVLEKAKVWYSFTEIRINPQLGFHPGVSAVVTQRFVANGDLIPGGAGPKGGSQSIVTVQVVDPVRVIADIPESDSIGLGVGTTTRITFPDFADTPMVQKISRTSNSLSSKSRTMRVEIDIANAQNKIRPGMMAYLELAVETHKAVLAVPNDCVVADRREASVFAVEGGKVKKIGVEVGLRNQDWVEISAAALTEQCILIKDIKEGIVDGSAVQMKQQ